MKKAVSGLILMVLVSLSACSGVRMQTNPAYTACLDGCMKEKNKCMLNAGTADAIGQCDKNYTGCMAPCSSMPSRIPAN